MSTYEGWTNYETWSVYLVLSSTEALQDEALAAALVGVTLGAPSEYWTEDQRRLYRSAESVEGWIRGAAEQAVPLDDRRPLSYLWAQLLGAALDTVDWQEVAAALLGTLDEREVT